MIRPRNALHALVLVACALVLASACDAGDDAPVVEPAPTEPAPGATPPADEPPDDIALRLAVVVDEQDEHDRIAAAASEAGYDVVEAAADAEITLSDRQLEGARPVTLDAWVAATDQRRDVLDLERDDVLAILTGGATDWSQLGGTEQPLALHLAEEDIERVEAAFQVGGLRDRADVNLVPGAELADAVATQPGAFALLPAPELRPDVLALVVDGHDPLRDPERESPLRLERWVSGDDDEQIQEALRLAGWSPRSLDFEPVSLLATGDIIPVRCTYARLAAAGDYGVMFDGTRELLQSADMVISPLDAGLTDRQPPTPCERTTMLHAPTGIAAAMAEAGIDIVATAVNHHMDCFRGCPPEAVHADTVGAIEDAGMVSVGAGENLDAARRPLFVEEGGIRFAFLAYDSIAPHWFATENRPGVAPLRWDTIDGMAEDVAAATEEADHVIVAFSWSQVEYVTAPDDLQRTAAHALAEAGASLIVGNHPHIVQASETIGDMFVIYALGNFIFDQDWSQETLDNLIMETGFTNERFIGYRMRPAVIREVHRPELVDPAGPEGQRILNRLWDATDALPPWGSAGRPE